MSSNAHDKTISDAEHDALVDRWAAMMRRYRAPISTEQLDSLDEMEEIVRELGHAPVLSVAPSAPVRVRALALRMVDSAVRMVYLLGDSVGLTERELFERFDLEGRRRVQHRALEHAEDCPDCAAASGRLEA